MGSAKRPGRSVSKNGTKPASIRLVASEHQGPDSGIRRIPIAEIDLNRRLCQFRLHENGQDYLTEELSRGDQIQPVLLRRIEGTHEIIDGFSRVECLVRLGETHVLARVYEGMSDEDAIALAVRCNSKRKNPSPVELAIGIARWLELTRETKAQAAEVFLLSLRQIDRYLKLLELPEELQRAVDEKTIPMGHALILRGRCRVSHSDWIQRIQAENLSREKLRLLLNRTLERGVEQKPPYVLRGSRLTVSRRSLNLSKLTLDDVVKQRAEYLKLYQLFDKIAGEKAASR